MTVNGLRRPPGSFCRFTTNSTRLLCEYPYRAKYAFETMDTHASIRISVERLELYSRFISEHGPRVRAAFPALAVDSAVWDAVDRLFVAMIVDRYEADIAFSFAHSMRRNISNENWRPVAYSFPPAAAASRLLDGLGPPAPAGTGPNRRGTRGAGIADAGICGSVSGHERRFAAHRRTPRAAHSPSAGCAGADCA